MLSGFFSHMVMEYTVQLKCTSFQSNACLAVANSYSIQCVTHRLQACKTTIITTNLKHELY